ncbi:MULTISPECIES: putative RNA methyltransferase [Oceanobacillus]|uniref:23S rRNA (guanine(745)-N(1))-methyltransferase N-terminal domain-containing protein n=1 Tax=Oceanobacillus indicireducens TaxID=1004261 RepID=A0A917Y4Z4_9BACI|nr:MULTISPECIES: hypothetical protein [Oceanobacillus]GGN66004.1 hypothetical protein GCM10007971_35450 [Oceanobacillus indicireducens]
MLEENTALLLNEHANIFICPVCGRKVEVVDHKSMICSNRDMFDFAKQRYINMLTRLMKVNYDKELFTARQRIIMKHNLYRQKECQKRNGCIRQQNSPAGLMIFRSFSNGGHEKQA